MAKSNLWTWEGGSWRVLSSYESNGEARLAAKRIKADGNDAVVTRDGDGCDEHIRAHCTQRRAPWNG